MTRRRRLGRPRGRPKWPARFVLAWCGIGVVGLGLFAFAFLGAPERLDSNLCPESGAISETVVLVDPSSQLTTKHESELDRLIREFKNQDSRVHIPPKGRLTAYHLPDVGEGPISAVATVCNPGTNPDDRRWIDDLTQGQLIALSRWRQFERELKPLFPEQSDEEHLKSPILETISVIVPRHIGHLSGNHSRRLHLVIWSDLLQNTNHLSQYGAYPDPDQFMSDGAFRHLKTDLRGTDVSIFRLERPNHEQLQDAAHYRWWREVLSAMGGRILRQESI